MDNRYAVYSDYGAPWIGIDMIVLIVVLTIFVIALFCIFLFAKCCSCCVKQLLAIIIVSLTSLVVMGIISGRYITCHMKLWEAMLTWIVCLLLTFFLLVLTSGTIMPRRISYVLGIEIDRTKLPLDDNDDLYDVTNLPRGRRCPRLIISITILCALLVIFIPVNVMLDQPCLTSSPYSLSTAITRRWKSSICSEDKICHKYVLAGPTCSAVTVVSHFVAKDKDTQPHSATVTIQLKGTTDDLSSTFSNDETLVTPQPLDMDWRTVVRGPISGLLCDSVYRATVTFVTTNESTLDTAQFYFKTIPDESKTAKIMGGGDIGYYPDITPSLLSAAQSRLEGADVLFVGGDIAYTNNIRYCYRRGDEVLHILEGTGFTRDSVFIMPIWMIGVGNHEAGGYLHASGKTERSKRFPFFLAYFPSSDALHHVTGTLCQDDLTCTASRIRVGSSAWLMLDSGTIISAASQKRYVASTLQAWKDDASVKATLAMYHNGAFPPYRPYDDKHAQEVRYAWIESMLTSKITMLLEHHDHVYFRSVPLTWSINEGKPVKTAGWGTIVSGAGSLGALRTKKKDRWYTLKNKNVNYILTLRIETNGTIKAEALAKDGSVIDQWTQNPAT